MTKVRMSELTGGEAREESSRDPVILLPGIPGAEVAMPVEYHEVAPGAVRGGDPRLRSAATGQALVEQLTEPVARFVQHHAGQAAREGTHCRHGNARGEPEPEQLDAAGGP